MMVSKKTLIMAGVGILLVIIIIASFNLKKSGSYSANNNAQITVDNNQANNDTPQLKTETLNAGSGDKIVKVNDFVVVNYTGMLQDGTVFDSSYKRNQPFGTYIGQGDVIKGWDQGLLGMKIGEKRRLTIPPQLGYGEKAVKDSAGNVVIPENSTLVFEIELLDIK